MAYGVADQLRGEQLGDRHEPDEAVHREDQPEGTATDGDGAEVVRDKGGGRAGWGATTPGIPTRFGTCVNSVWDVGVSEAGAAQNCVRGASATSPTADL